MPDKTVILIEDNSADIALALKAFKVVDGPHKIRVLEDGAKALDYFFGMGAHKGKSLNHLPAMVLLDLKLPKVSGFEVLNLLRSHASTQSIPVIVFSSSSLESDIEKAYQLGANAYVAKPFDYHNYKRVMQAMVGFWLNHNQTI